MMIQLLILVRMMISMTMMIMMIQLLILVRMMMSMTDDNDDSAVDIGEDDD